MNSLYKKAILKADQIRMQLGLNMFEPINIFDSCIQLGLSVRFVDVSMEGMYFIQEDKGHPTILLSNQRPLPRRVYTCAHELGHHVFGHGTKVDALADFSNNSTSQNDRDESLVDSFAGSLLMPVAGVRAAFAKRNWSVEAASPLQFYTISSVFGSGYQTLIVHCRTNNIISKNKADNLSKHTPAKILKNLIGSEIKKSYFKIIDKDSQVSVIDLEVSNYIVLPDNFIIEGNHLQKCLNTSLGVAYIATTPGILHVANSDNGSGHFIRIQKSLYVGLAKYHHLENELD